MKFKWFCMQVLGLTFFVCVNVFVHALVSFDPCKVCCISLCLGL